jgi:hypothetical protein
MRWVVVNDLAGFRRRVNVAQLVQIVEEERVVHVYTTNGDFEISVDEFIDLERKLAQFTDDLTS